MLVDWTTENSTASLNSCRQAAAANSAANTMAALLPFAFMRKKKVMAAMSVLRI